jgi:hypothetical protein
VASRHPRHRRQGRWIHAVGLIVGLEEGLDVGDGTDPGVAVRGTGVGALRGVVADGRELAGQELESARDGGVVVGGEGTATHVDDARQATRPPPDERSPAVYRPLGG